MTTRKDLRRLQELAAHLGYTNPGDRVGTLWNRVYKTPLRKQLPPRWVFRPVENLSWEDAMEVAQ